MKKFSPWSASFAIIVLLVFSAVSASAQSWSWNGPCLITPPVTGPVTAIRVDSVTETPYGMSGDTITPLTVSAPLTSTAVITAPATTPLVAFTTDARGVLYAISESGVMAWSAGTFTFLANQPYLPPSADPAVPMAGIYKDITVGKGGKLYVLFETAEDGAQYLLVGTPPALTAGVALKISPSVINLASKGNWVTAAITPPEGYDAEDIIPESVKIVWVQGSDPLGAAIDQAAEITMVSSAPHSVSGGRLLVKLPRYNKQNPTSLGSLTGLLTDLFPAGETKATYSVTITIQGQLLSTGEFFTGTTTLTVMSPKAKAGKKK